jgi:hypothetical protein
MENNQEHKIDKILKHSLGNQSVTPPADAWTGILTYTIGQEETKRKIGLRYVSLALVVLLFSGFGLWWYFNLRQPRLNSDYETSHRADSQVSGLNTQSKIEKSDNPVDSKSNNVDLKISTLKSNKKIRESINRYGATFRNPNSDNNDLIISTIISNKKIHKSSNLHGATFRNPNSDNLHKLLVENSNKDRDNENTNKILNPDSVENFTYSNDNIISSNNEKQIEIIEPKPLIFNDLSKRINKQLLAKIDEDYLEERTIQKDSIAEEIGRKRFSLKHPIINFGVELSNTNWNIMRDTGMNNWKEPLGFSSRQPLNSDYSLKIGVSWRLSSRFRSGLNISYRNMNLGSYPSLQVPYSSNIKYNFDYASRNSSNNNYQVRTAFGDIEIPANKLKKPQGRTDSTSVNLWFGPHSMKVITLSLTNQYDFIKKQRKKGRKFGYQIYGLMDLSFQRQLKYSFQATNVFLAASSTLVTDDIFIRKEESHLQNASEFVFGLRAGLGFRYQFAKKWDFYLEGSGQHSLNNWVKSDDIKTFQRTLSLQAGINFNL